MVRRLLPFLTLAGLACGGHPAEVTPQVMSQAVTQFLDAVKANDLARMGALWGDPRGPATSYMNPRTLQSQLRVIQIYLNHTGYRIVDGPVPARPLNPTYTNVPSLDKLRDYHVELQRDQCNRVVPITIVQTKRGSWIVYDVHLEAAGNPAKPCGPQAPGTND